MAKTLQTKLAKNKKSAIMLTSLLKDFKRKW